MSWWQFDEATQSKLGEVLAFRFAAHEGGDFIMTTGREVAAGTFTGGRPTLGSSSRLAPERKWLKETPQAAKKTAERLVTGGFGWRGQTVWCRANAELSAWVLAMEQSTSAFLRSTKAQLEERGCLSEAQAVIVRRIMTEMRAKDGPGSWAGAPSLEAGAVIEVKPWVANRIGNLTGHDPVFVNLEVVELCEENNWGLRLRLAYHAKVARVCHVCGMLLDTRAARASGIGPVCADRLGIARPQPENVVAVLAAIAAYAKRQGVLAPIWVNKAGVVSPQLAAAPQAAAAAADDGRGLR